MYFHTAVLLIDLLAKAQVAYVKKLYFESKAASIDLENNGACIAEKDLDSN